jgi:hypothetical protein
MWGSGPFANDAAADFLDELQQSPSRGVAKTLSAIAGRPHGSYLDIDDGAPGWAACELVALAFGRGETATLDDSVLDLLAKLKPKEERRQLALHVLPRIRDRATSELRTSSRATPSFASSGTTPRTAVQTCASGCRC